MACSRISATFGSLPVAAVTSLPPRPAPRGPSAAALAEVLDETACALDESGESAWAGVSPQPLAATLRAERDALLETGRLRDPGELQMLFRPNGEIQDTSDSGRGRLYVDLASRFDDALAAYTPPPPTASASGRQRAHPGRWLTAGLVVGLVVWRVSVGGGRALLGVAAILAAVAVAGFGWLAWIFQDGPFTRLPSFREAVTEPRRVTLWLAPLLASGALLVWGVWTLAHALGGP